MKSFRHILVSILLIASFVSTAQVRTKIQDYSNVATLQSETLISKDNDKIYVKSINTIFAWNVTSTATHDGINVIKQTNIATGRFIKVNPEIGANVRYGTAIPVVITSDRKGDSYVLTDTGINTGIVQSVWVYDASIWKKTVTITDPVIDFSVNADPNTALTTFSPNLPPPFNHLKSIFALPPARPPSPKYLHQESKVRLDFAFKDELSLEINRNLCDTNRRLSRSLESQFRAIYGRFSC